MPHIKLPEELPGITAGFAFRPETAKPMRALAHILLHEPNSLTGGERELIATYVSSRNKTTFCELSHGAAAASHLGGEAKVKQVKTDFASADISPKLKALLAIAGKVQRGGKCVTPRDVEVARDCGATDIEIHDTVLISAMFCMCNRYVDGLATWAPQDPGFYRDRAAKIAADGYVASTAMPAATAAR